MNRRKHTLRQHERRSQALLTPIDDMPACDTAGSRCALAVAPLLTITAVFTDDEVSEAESADHIFVKSPEPKEIEAAGRTRRRNAAPAKVAEPIDDDEDSDEELDEDV